jgi:hypothetical protein
MVTPVKSNSPSVQPASPSTSGPASQASESRSESPIQSTSPRSESPTGLQSRQQAQSLAGGGSESPLAGGSPVSSLAGGGPANEGIQQGAAVGPNDVSTDPEIRMRNDVATHKADPKDRARQANANAASAGYKRRWPTVSDITAIGNQSLATAAGSAVAFGGRGVANTLVDTAAKTAIPDPYIAAAASGVVKHGIGTLAAAAGTQLNQTKVAPFLDQHTGARHIPTPVPVILPDERREALNGFKADYGNKMAGEIESQQKAAGANPTAGALAYGVGSLGASVAQSLVTDPLTKAAVVAGGPTIGGALLGAKIGHQKATSTYYAPTGEGITKLDREIARRAADNDPYDSDGMKEALKNIEKEPHNLYYTDNPSADTKAAALAEKAAKRPRTKEGIYESLTHRATVLERGLRATDGLQTLGAIAGAGLGVGVNPLAGTLATAAVNAVGIGSAVQPGGLLAEINAFPANDVKIAAGEPPIAPQGLGGVNQVPLGAPPVPAPEDLVEQGRAQL